MKYLIEIWVGHDWQFYCHCPHMKDARERAIEKRNEGKRVRIVMRIELEEYDGR